MPPHRLATPNVICRCPPHAALDARPPPSRFSPPPPHTPCVCALLLSFPVTFLVVGEQLQDFRHAGFILQDLGESGYFVKSSAADQLQEEIDKMLTKTSSAIVKDKTG